MSQRGLQDGDSVAIARTPETQSRHLVVARFGNEVTVKRFVHSTSATWFGTSVDGTDGPEGRLEATGAAVTRLRTRLEGSSDYALGDILSLKPPVEVGLGQDGGDAETGARMDVRGGLTVSAPTVRLSVDVRVRMLLVQQAEEVRGRGMSISATHNPKPSTPLRFTPRVAPSWAARRRAAQSAVGPEDDGGDGGRRLRRRQPARLARSGTGSRSAAGSWGLRESASARPNTAGTTGQAMGSACCAAKA